MPSSQLHAGRALARAAQVLRMLYQLWFHVCSCSAVACRHCLFVAPPPLWLYTLCAASSAMIPEPWKEGWFGFFECTLTNISSRFLVECLPKEKDPEEVTIRFSQFPTLCVHIEAGQHTIPSQLFWKLTMDKWLALNIAMVDIEVVGASLGLGFFICKCLSKRSFFADRMQTATGPLTKGFFSWARRV